MDSNDIVRIMKKESVMDNNDHHILTRSQVSTIRQVLKELVGDTVYLAEGTKEKIVRILWWFEDDDVRLHRIEAIPKQGSDLCEWTDLNYETQRTYIVLKSTLPSSVLEKFCQSAVQEVKERPQQSVEVLLADRIRQYIESEYKDRAYYKLRSYCQDMLKGALDRVDYIDIARRLLKEKEREDVRYVLRKMKKVRC